MGDGGATYLVLFVFYLCAAVVRTRRDGLGHLTGGVMPGRTGGVIFREVVSKASFFRLRAGNGGLVVQKGGNVSVTHNLGRCVHCCLHGAAD